MAMTYIPVVVYYISVQQDCLVYKSYKRQWSVKAQPCSWTLDGVICRIGLALLLGITFNWGIKRFGMDTHLQDLYLLDRRSFLCFKMKARSL